MDITEIKQELTSVSKKISYIKETLKVDSLRVALIELEKQVQGENFWDDSENSSKVLQSIKEKKNIVDMYDEIVYLYDEAYATYELLTSEQDVELEKELVSQVDNIKEVTNTLELQSLFSGEYDNMNSIITIHPGAGGTESQDWALMLYRMYTKWCEKNDYTIEIYDYQDGDTAGIKSVTFMVKGQKAYGYLKCENGVHRLVRISPFDANSRRHTSFAAVEVMPEIDDNIKLDIKEEDLEMGTYRASGAGGQHVNKTDSAVRIKHIPSGVVVTCQTERSQLQNRENAMKMLKAKLYQLELQKNKDKLSEIKGEQDENGWGSQIRSYVFCPYTLVKDHRTGFEVGNITKVMDGDITDFMFEYLKYLKNGI